MNSNTWVKCKINDICRIRRGASPRPIQDYISEQGIPWVKISDATSSGSRFIDSTNEYIKEDGKEKSRFIEKGTLILSNSATPGIPKIMGIDACVHDGWLIIDEFKNVTQEFLYYSFIYERDRLLNLSNGSVFRNLKTDIVKNYEINLPGVNEQKAIAKVLSDLDEKIETNNKINKKLEEMAQAIFKQWFVDFEFPNEDGKPYKSSGGEMVESELGMIPKEWEISELGEIIELFDSKRIPLSKNERQKREKIYPYYGAASLMDYVDDYIFDGVYILMGEDGTVVTSDGYPILQYVWGKFWVNNHAHVIKGKCSIPDEFIYILLKNTNVKTIVTGAVQPKINQQNLKSLKIVIPGDEKLLLKYKNIVKNSFEQIRVLSEENKTLIKLRDTLLPKLMSGEIRVPMD